MSFSINIPTRIIFGRGCVKANAELFMIGKKAYIVTGKHGAAASGALGDVTEMLEKNGIDYQIFDKATENPPLLEAFSGGKEAREHKCDLVIGIGGGSAMDCAKAIAAFAVNAELEPLDIYDSEKIRKPSLPIILIPTTSGTGSEANPYSVLTLPDGLRKKSFNSKYSWAKYAFVDPAYTDSLPYGTTISTALDAFAHAMESFLSPKSTDFSRMLAIYSGKKIWNVLTEYPDEFTKEHRDELSAASCAAGAAISITGTGFPHPLGYSLTLLYGIPHGKACAAFHGDYIAYNLKNEAGETLLREFAAAIGATVKLMEEYLPALAGVDLTMTEDEILKCVDLVKGAKNYTNSPYVLNEDEMISIYHNHFSGRRK